MLLDRRQLAGQLRARRLGFRARGLYKLQPHQRTLLLLDRGRHRIEGACQLPNLIAAIESHARIEIACREALDARRKAAQRRAYGARYEHLNQDDQPTIMPPARSAQLISRRLRSAITR